MASLCRDALRHWFGFMASDDGFLLPFVFAQRWHFHLGLARIGSRHGLAVVAQIHLRIPFGIARRFCPFRPCVAVAVQRNSFDAQTNAALMKFRRPVARADSPQIGKQWAAARQVAQDFRHVFVKTHDGNRVGFHPLVADDVVVPINILGFKECQVGLRRAQAPSQFVERLAFGILFAGDNGQMFGQGDTAFFLELNGGPAFLGQHRPRQPGHVQGEVVNAPQINIGGNFPGFQHAQEMFGARFQKRQMPNQVERLVFDGRLPAVLGLVFFELHQFVHDELPVSRGNLFVTGSEIRAGDLQVHGGLLLGFLTRVEQPKRRRAVGGVQAVLLLCHVVVNVVAAAFFPFIESVSLFHNCVSSDEVTTIDLDSGRERVGVKWSRSALNFAGTSAGTQPWKFSKLRSSNWLNLEARVGIGQFIPACCTPNIADFIGYST